MKKKTIFTVIIIILAVLIAAYVIFLRADSADEPEPVSSQAPAEEIDSDVAASKESVAPSEEPEVIPEKENSETVNEEESWDPGVPESSAEPIPVDPSAGSSAYTEFERYNDMSGEEQKAFIDSFASLDDFVAWYNNAKAEYENTHKDIILDGNTSIDFGS